MSAANYSDTVRSLVLIVIAGFFAVIFIIIPKHQSRLKRIEAQISVEQPQTHKPEEVKLIFDFKFDRGSIWLFIQPESQADVGRLAELFLYLDEEGKYRGETIGLDITNILAYIAAKQTHRLDSDYRPGVKQEPAAGGQEGQEGKRKPSILSEEE